MQVIINRCYGGFNFSHEAIKLYESRTGSKVQNPRDLYYDGLRNDPEMVEVFKELGSERASGSYSKLSVEEVPEGYDFEIQEYDGLEHIELRINEAHLRDIIRNKSEEDVAEYVLGAQNDTNEIGV